MGGTPIEVRYWRRDMWALGEAAAERRGSYDFSTVGPKVGEEAEDELSAAQMDQLLQQACAFLRRNGFDESHLPAPLEVWLESGEGVTFIELTSDILARCVPS